MSDPPNIINSHPEGITLKRRSLTMAVKTTFKTYSEIATAQAKAEKAVSEGKRVVAIRGRLARVLGVTHKVWEVQIEG